MSDPDSLAISRAIDALKDPTAQAVVVAIIDRVQGMIGHQELRSADEQAAFTVSLDRLTDEQMKLAGQLESMKVQMGRMTTQMHELRLEIEALRLAKEAGA